MLTFHLIAHTHWDREWYATRAEFGARFVGVLDDLMERLERDPLLRHVHLDGQTVLLEDFVAIRPGREPRVRRLVEGGRIGTGPWYVLADEQIPAGESLLRNLLHGLRDTRSWGARAPVCYSPDAFGHPAILPQLALEAGCTSAVLWRGLAGSSDLVGWRTPDGRELLVYHLPPEGYEIGASLLSEPPMVAARWPGIRDTLVVRAATSHVAVFVGADHHAAPRNLPGLAEELRQLEPGANVRISSLEEFFRDAVAEAEAVPSVEGALRQSGGYTWALQGCHGTRAPLKRRNAKVELGLSRVVEPLAALARLAGGLDRRPLLDRAWRLVLQSQFHDTLCGTCADPVADEAMMRFRDAESIGEAIVRGCIHGLTGHDPDRARDDPSLQVPRLLVWNPAARVRSKAEGEVVTAELTFLRRTVLVGPPGNRAAEVGPGYRPFALRDPEGERIPVQVLAVRRDHERIDAVRHYPVQREIDRVWIAFQGPRLGGLALAALTVVEPNSAPAGDVETGHTWLSNAWIRIVAEPDGTLTMQDRRTGELYAGLGSFVWEADSGDTYSVCSANESGSGIVCSDAHISLVATGPLLGALEVVRHATLPGHGPVTLRIIVTLRSGSAAVGLRVEIDNAAIDHRLRLAFPIGVAGVLTTGTAFGTEWRRPGALESPGDSPLETPVTTGPTHRYAVAAEGTRGLGLFLPGFAETEWTWDGALLLTVLRSVGELSRADLPTRPGHAGWPTRTPGAQCRGRDVLDLVLLPVDGDDVGNPARLEMMWEDAILPVRTRWEPDHTGIEPIHDGEVSLEGEGLVFSALKPADRLDRTVFRCWNASHTSVDGCLRVTGRFAVRAATRVRADERGDDRQLEVTEGAIRFVAGPRELVTIRLG